MSEELRMAVAHKQLVSVIVPAYNAEPFLADAVRSALAQTWGNVEVIIIDDGSTDGTGAIADGLAARDRRVRVVHCRNGGLSSARNVGLSVAKGEFVCFLDADDMFLPEKIERQAAFLAVFPGCDLVYSDHYVGDSTLTPMLLACRRPPFPIEEILTFRNWFAPISPLLRSSFAERIGGFDETLRGSEDWDYWIRASQCGVLSYLPGPVGVYRTHPAQMTTNWARMRTCIQKVITKHRARGSESWENSRATTSMLTAKHEWASGRYVETAWNLAAYAWHMRSWRRRKRMAALNSLDAPVVGASTRSAAHVEKRAESRAVRISS